MSRLREKCNVIISTITKMITSIVPKKKNRWIFGAWYGDRVSDNSKAICDYVENNHPEIEIIWITNNPECYTSSRCMFVKRNSLKSIKYIVTAKVAFMNQGYADFFSVNLLGGCITVQLWHGVAWKKIGEDAIGFDRSLLALKRYIGNYEYYIAPANNYAKIIKKAFCIRKGKILKVGQPRNDILYSKKFRDSCKRKILSSVSSHYNKIVVYMPTFRDNKMMSFSFFDMSVQEKIRNYELNDVLFVEKKHYIDIGRSKTVNSQLENTINGNCFDTQELLAAADVLVTDYSSCFFDYLITDRPIIHYIFDYEYYSDLDRGLYYNLDDVACGDIKKDIDGLLKSIKKGINDADYQSELRENRRKMYITFETNQNCRKIINYIMKKISLR